MKSIKPGRGPSAMGAIGSVAVGLFGIFWTIGAASMGAPIFIVFFGIIFVGMSVIQGIYHFKNATGTNRMSLYDVTEAHEEPDPFDNQRMQHIRKPDNQNLEGQIINEYNFCPFCGNKVTDHSFKFCPKCGNELNN